MIELHYQGEKDVQRAFEKVSDPSRRLDLMERIGAALQTATEFRFEQERGPDGKPWKKSRRARKEGGKTLRDGAHLVNSLTYQAQSDSVAIGTNKIYAAIHQFGGIIRPKTKKKLAFRGANGFAMVDKVTIPARPFLGIDVRDHEEISDITHEWLAEGVGV